MNSIKVGLLGIGTVGSGVFNILKRNSKEITRRLGCNIEIIMVADINIERANQLTNKEVTVVNDPNLLIFNPEICIVIELIGGNDIAKDLVFKAIENGKHVVTANKALIATYGNEIFRIAEKKGVIIAFEAAIAGGIPIIKALREGLTANKIQWIVGIINGTTNFILTEMQNKALDFNKVLKEAQNFGYAEIDPTFDIEGIDAAHKITILASLAFGIPIQFKKTYIEGITHLQASDIQYAKQFGYNIKLLGITRLTSMGIEIRVHPTLIPLTSLMANVDGVMNAIMIYGDAVGETLYYGKGAGSEATASAVIADLVDIARLSTVNQKNRVPHLAFQPYAIKHYTPIIAIQDVTTSYYLRICVVNISGVLADITHILAHLSISIYTMLQKRILTKEKYTDIAILTYKTQEYNIEKAIKKIEKTGR